MKKNYKKFKLYLGLIFVLGINFKSQAQLPVTVTFSHTGAVQQFTVPPCVGSMTIEMRAASGGAGGSGGPAGANGGAVRGVYTAMPGSVMYLYVGGQGSVTAGGFNGGGGGGTSSTSQGAGGGGGTDVRIGGMALANRVMVAGAGGGGGGNSTYAPVSGAGGGGSPFTSASGFGGTGAGGCAIGANGGESGGSAPTYGSGGGGGGFSSGGGGGGQPAATTGGWGCPGALGAGGAGGGTSFICGGATGGVNGGGGGGGGYYGGGGGMTGTGGCNGGGGGGSSWANNTMFTGITYTAGIQSGHGSITLTYAFNGSLVSATVNPFAICVGNSANITASGATTYTWSTGSFANNITVAPVTTTNYTVTGTNSIGCISSAVATVTVNTLAPTLTLTTSANTICPTNTVMLTASGALSYTWTGGVTNGVAFAPLTTNTYIVSGQNGCSTTTAAITITVTALPVVGIVSPTIVCAGSTATLSAGGATTYTWQPGGIVGTNVFVSPQTNTTYTVTGAQGTCFGINTVSLATKPNPTVAVTASSMMICLGQSATLTATGALTYTWQPGGMTGPSVVVSPTVPTGYSVIGENSVNCTASVSQPVITQPSPTVVASGNSSSICAGNSATLFATGGHTYLWSNGATTQTIVVSPATNTFYTVTGTSTVSGCSNTSTINIGVLESTITITPSSSVCIGNTVTLTATGGVSYTWSTGDNGSGIIITPTISSTYFVNALAAFGTMYCPGSASTAVTVNQLPVINVIATKSVICKNSQHFTLLTASGALNYVWNNGATTSTISVNPNNTTVYTVTGTDDNTCVNTKTIEIKVVNCPGFAENIESNAGSILIFPNPNNGEFTIQAETQLQLNLINELGQLIKTINLNSENNFESRIKDLPNGIYFIESSDVLFSIKQKVIIQK